MPKYRIQSLIFILTTFMLGCNEYMIVGVLSDIHKDFGTSMSDLGILITAFALTYAIATPLVSILTSKFKRHQVYFGLLAVFFIGNTWTALASNYLSLMGSRILTASTAGAICSLTLTMTNFVVPQEKRAATIAWVFAGFNIASVAGVPLGTFISTNWGWHASYWLVDIVAVITISLLIFLVPRNTPQAIHKEDAASAGSVKDFMLDQRVILTVSFIMAICAAQFSFYTYIRPIITGQMGFSVSSLNLLLLILGLMAIVGNNLGGWCADNGGVKILPRLYIIMGIFLIIAGLTMKNLAVISFICIAIVCIFNSSYGATVQVLMMDIASKESPAALDLASSLNPVFSNVGISVGSFLAAQMLHFTTVNNIVYLSAIFAFAGFGIIFQLKRIYTK